MNTPITHEFTFEGRAYTLFKRRPSPDAPWYFRIQRAGKRSPRSLETNIAPNAVTKAKAMITAAKGEKWAEFLGKTALRTPCTLHLNQIITLYRAYPNRRPIPKTRELNIHALLEILTPPDAAPYTEARAATIPLSQVTADALWTWKQKILAAAGADDITDDRHRQLLRSANSRLTQARSLFTRDLQSYYKRQGKLTLPKTLDDFLKEPKFPADETGKTDYWPPNDAIIAKTFAALEQLVPGAPPLEGYGPTQPVASPAILEENLNLYKIVWLTLGFGLRKSEISLTRASWFQEIHGAPYIAGDELAKNKKFPRVRCQLGAWDKLARLLVDKNPDDFILDGTAGERTDQVFRRCSDWMRALGWKTQKAIHEFRAWAGCQIAMGNEDGRIDLRAAQEFLRHAHITTTENFYMRYLRTQLKEVHLQLPVAKPFTPKIVVSA